MIFLLKAIEKVAKPKTAYAHCDIPCGIYETDTMQHAADTVIKMVEKILELKHPPEGDHQKHIEYENTMSRMVHVKEEWAQKCKQEILILWTDYFKDEHLAKHQDLHTKVWKAAKLCSQAKRSVDMNAAKQLKDAVSEIAGIFAETKK
ncbi:superoxide dismutase, Ni [Candidatus Woesearchaeota archaeon]|nr:superoxide dismutase, Ni [Candidatus Woesearchaeota archaeon]